MGNMLKQMNSTSLLAIILFIANTIYLIEGFRISPPIQNGSIGITTWPILVSILFYIPVILIIFDGIKGKSKVSFSKKSIFKITILLLLTIIFILILKPMGYFIASAIYVFSLMFLFEFDRKEYNIRSLIFDIFFKTVIVVIVFYVFYAFVFNVRLPFGEVF